MKDLKEREKLYYNNKNLIKYKNFRYRFHKSSHWQSLREKVFKKYGIHCMKCNSTKIPSIDHILPISLFPELMYDINNMQVLCLSCNREKSNKKFNDYTKSWLSVETHKQKTDIKKCRKFYKKFKYNKKDGNCRTANAMLRELKKNGKKFLKPSRPTFE